VGHSFTAFWARLARLRIVASIEEQHAGAFWKAEPAMHAAVLRRLSETGASAVVAAPTTLTPLPPGWQPVGETGYLFHALR
jgi:hypothetical protein